MKCLLLFTLVTSVLIAIGYYKFNELTRPLPLPSFDTNKYWGPGDGSKYKEDKAIKPFVIKADPELIKDLRSQLNRTLKLTEPLEGIKFEYGYNTNALAQVVDYWRDTYMAKWQQREEFLNGLPHFTTEIQGLRIHFIHAKPSAEVLKTKKVLPVLLLNGWPSSVRELFDFTRLLIQPSPISDYVYEVVAPSLVGFGWSDPARKVGFNAAEMAIVLRNLMLRLGYQKFLVQGGDWGSVIGGDVATIFPDNVIGFHSHMCVMSTPLSIMKDIVAGFKPEKFVPSPLCHAHHFPLSEKLAFLMRESGYFHIQATKPDTIGTALLANPIGMASYYLEKFNSAISPALNHNFNALHEVFTMDALLDNIMVYYLTNTATTAARFYKENMSKAYLGLELQRVQTPVPMGCARFRYDLQPALDWQLKDKYPNFIHSTYYNEGGHFVVLEAPAMLYTDFAEFVNKIQLN